MSDNAQPTPSAVPEQTAATEAAVRAEAQATATRESQSILNADPNAAPEQVDEKQPQSTTTWPDDWRERWAGKDDQLLSRLKRFTTPDNVFKSYLEIEKRVRSGQFQPALPDGASEEEVAAYRQKAGIPETPDGYELKFPEGMEAPETVKEQLAVFKRAMHDVNASPQTVNKAWETYLALQEAEAQQRWDRGQEKLVDTQAMLRSEWGRDYEANKNIGNRFIAQYGGEEARDMMKWELSDGTPLGAHPAFIKMMVNAGRVAAGDMGAVWETSGGGKSVEDQITEQMELMRTNPAEYDKPENEAKRMKLYAAKNAQAASQSRAA